MFYIIVDGPHMSPEQMLPATSILSFYFLHYNQVDWPEFLKCAQVGCLSWQRWCSLLISCRHLMQPELWLTLTGRQFMRNTRMESISSILKHAASIIMMLWSHDRKCTCFIVCVSHPIDNILHFPASQSRQMCSSFMGFWGQLLKHGDRETALHQRKRMRREAPTTIQSAGRRWRKLHMYSYITIHLNS